jgi:hypothetical protein
MRLLLPLFLLMIAAIPQARAAITWTESELGLTAMVPMENAPFPHPSRAEGHHYKEVHYPAATHYSDNTVALFIPAGFRPTPTTDLVFYWHGWNNSVAAALDSFRLREQFVAAGRNAILVFPEGPKNAPDSSMGRMEDEGAIRRLADEVMGVLRAEGRVPADAALGRVILSGHSGAFRGIAACVRHGGLGDHLAEVWLLDASYSQLDAFVGWVTANPGRAVLHSVFTDHLAPQNYTMIKGLHDAGVTMRLLVEDEVGETLPPGTRVSFTHATKSDHNGAVRFFEIYLRSSQLDAR